MSDEKRRILQMLAEGKITVDEATQLLEALASQGSIKVPDKPATSPGGEAKYLRIIVRQSEGAVDGKKDVNIRIPLALVKAGVKLGHLLPGDAQDKISRKLHEKGIDLDLRNLDQETLNQLITALRETSIEVDADNEKVRIFCE